jgi:hypothetical protein
MDLTAAKKAGQADRSLRGLAQKASARDFSSAIAVEKLVHPGSGFERRLPPDLTHLLHQN